MGIDLSRFKGKRDKEWLDWLEDDPVPASIRSKMREKAVQNASQPTVRRVGQENNKPTSTSDAKKSETPVKQISVNIQLPNIDKLKSKTTAKAKQSLQWTKQKVSGHKRIAVGAASIAIIGVGAFTVLQMKSNSTTSDNGGRGVLSEKTEKPNFDYSLPKGEESNADGEVRYDAGKKVVNFQDSIGGVTITISQQPLPEGFDDDTDAKVKKLAEDFSANKPITTANPTAYLGTSAKGPQTVVFAKKNLLVFIQSAKTIDEKDWAEYVTNLE